MAILNSGITKGLGIAMVAGTGYDTYRSQREKGRGTIGSLATAAATGILWQKFQWPLLGAQLAPVIPMLAQASFRNTADLQKRAMPMMGLGGMPDSAEAQTSRARGILAIQESRLNARSYLGSEAGLFAARYH